MTAYPQVRVESDMTGHHTKIFVGDIELTDILPICGAELSWRVDELNKVSLDLHGVVLSAQQAAGTIDLVNVLKQLAAAFGAEEMLRAADKAFREEYK